VAFGRAALRGADGAAHRPYFRPSLELGRNRRFTTLIFKRAGFMFGLIFMGIRDRDYMKRPSDDDDERNSSLESRAEEMAQRILVRSRKAILIVGIALVILIVAGLIVAKFSAAK
jgi:hypothetical protein